MFVVSQPISAKKKKKKGMSQLDLLITALYFSVCCEKYSITKNTWDVIIMKNLNTNDSEFYCSPLVVLHVKPTFVSSEWTLSIQLGSGKIRINNNKKTKNRICRFFRLTLHY